MKYCSKCGTPNHDSNQVCDNCKISFEEEYIQENEKENDISAEAVNQSEQKTKITETVMEDTLVQSESVVQESQAEHTVPVQMKKTRKSKKTIFIPMIILGLFIITIGILIMTHIICLEHSYVPVYPTCINPMKCKYCGDEVGTPSGHDWKDATCIDPQKCSICDTIQGEPVGHIWNDATCVLPKTCSVCGETEGDPLEHIEGGWKTYSTDMIEATVTSKKYCTECQDELDTQTVSLKQLYYGSEFMATPVEFVNRLNKMLDRIDGNTLSAEIGSAKEEFACGIFDNDIRVSIILFGNEEGAITVEQENTPCFQSILGTAEDGELWARIMLAIILTSDPSLTFSEARDVVVQLIEEEEKTINGITYCVYFVDEGVIFSMSISE